MCDAMLQVAFASVMTKAGLNSVADIETARAALSAEMTKLSSVNRVRSRLSKAALIKHIRHWA